MFEREIPEPEPGPGGTSADGEEAPAAAASPSSNGQVSQHDATVDEQKLLHERVSHGKRLVQVNLGVDIGLYNDSLALCLCYVFEEALIAKADVHLPQNRAGQPASAPFPSALRAAFSRAAGAGRLEMFAVQIFQEWEPRIPPSDVARRMAEVWHEIFRDVGRVVRQLNAEHPYDPTDPFALPPREVVAAILLDKNGMGAPYAEELNKVFKGGDDEVLKHVKIMPITTVGTQAVGLDLGTLSAARVWQVNTLQRLIGEKRLTLPEDDPLLKKLIGQFAIYEERISASGHQSYGNATGTGLGSANEHDDLIAALQLATLYSISVTQARMGAQLF